MSPQAILAELSLELWSVHRNVHPPGLDCGVQPSRPQPARSITLLKATEVTLRP
jgi:hypothetical protein